jgi:hypothetical protein
MVIYDLDILSISLGPSEADTPLVVEANAYLPCPIPFQGFKSIAGRIA